MLRKLIAEYLTKLEANQTQHGLDIKAILGRPHTGRAEPQLPLSAVTFAQDGDMVASDGRTVRRLGMIPATGRTVTANLYLYATGEPELFDLVDRLHHTKKRLVAITIDGVQFVIRYDTTERLPEGEDPIEDFAVVTPVTFSTTAEG